MTASQRSTAHCTGGTQRAWARVGATRIEVTLDGLRQLIDRVDRELGKNTAYVAIAVGLLKQGHSSDVSLLWSSVKSRYRDLTGKEPADREQGEIKLVAALFAEGHMR